MYSSNSSSPSLRHLVFFETLAGLKETDVEWRSTTAGLVVLRLFDAWMDEGEVVLQDRWGMSAVREAIDAVDTGTPVRSILKGVVDAMTESPVPDVAIVGPRLLAYGRALDIAGRWHLAADVYRSIIAHANPVEDSDIAIDANMQLGYCASMLSDWQTASASYELAGQIAEASSDIVKVLRARFADAKLLTDLGNLPGAESVLDAAIVRADKLNVGEIGGLLKHQRATVAFLRGEYERSIRLAYEAILALQSPTARDRALADLAAAFGELGCRTAARDAHLILAATAQEQYTRWMATINLMELASFDMREPNFEQYRRELVDSPLPPSLSAAYFLYVGQGYQRFRKFDLAEQAIEHAIEIANSNKLNQLLFQAESALLAVRTGRFSDVPHSVAPVPALRDIAESIQQMRMAVATSG